MPRHILLDASMVHHAIHPSRWFAAPSPLYAPLMPRDEMHLAGPILIDADLAKEKANSVEIGRLIDNFPARLHIAVLDSALPLDELAAHLRHFVCIRDDAGASYGLRIADCRVMAYLPEVLSPDQWDALTAPITQWHVHDRRGEVHALRLNDTRLEHSAPPQPLSLSDAQIARLIDEGEADGLLDQIDQAPTRANAPHLDAMHEAATACLRHWKASGNASRAALLCFARLVFQAGMAAHRDDAHMAQWLSQAVASTR